MPTKIKAIVISITTSDIHYKTLVENQIELRIPQFFNTVEINRHIREIASMMCDEHESALSLQNYFEVKDEKR